MKFAGFNPQQQYTLLTKMGYTGPMQEDEMESAIMANPAWAARMGKMAQAAQSRLDNKARKFATGGYVDGQWDPNLNVPEGYEPSAYGYGSYSPTTGEPAPTNTSTDTTPTVAAMGSTQTDLDAAQQAYADALQAATANPNDQAAQEALVSAQQALTSTQQAFNITEVPTAGEAMATGINDPLSVTTQQDVATIQPTNEQLIAAGTGQQTSTPTATAATVSDPNQVTAEEATAQQAVAAQTTAANTYDATKVGDAVEGTLDNLQAATADPTASATVQGQLATLMADFEDGTPPWASGAMREATALMQRRGMGASSMAGEAIVLAAMQAALPIAQADANTYAQFEMQNLNNEQQTTIFKAQQRINSLFSDQSAENASKQFNATSKNQTDQFFAGLETTVSQFNAAQVNAISQFNAEQRNVASRFNVEQQTTVDLFRAREENAISQFNTQIQQQRDQFNATNDLVIAQANTKWMQQISTINTATQNVANRDTAQFANQLTQRQIDHLHQYERDMMAFAFQSAESAEDRNLSLLLADKDLAASRELMDAQQKSAIGGALFDVFF